VTSETSFAGLPPPFEPGVFPSSSDRPFVPGLARPVSGPFGLCGRMLSLASISVALSLHRKIPFLADKVSHGSPTSADWQRRLFWGVPSIPLSKWSPGLRMLVLAVPASWSPLLRRDSLSFPLNTSCRRRDLIHSRRAK
jgi:hypothetical protein